MHALYIHWYAFMFLLYIGLPFFFGYAGGRLKRHSIGLLFAFSPLILILVISVVSLVVKYGISGMFESFLRFHIGFGIEYSIVAFVGYIIGFLWETIRLRWKPLPTESEPSQKKGEGAGDISRVWAKRGILA